MKKTIRKVIVFAILTLTITTISVAKTTDVRVTPQHQQNGG